MQDLVLSPAELRALTGYARPGDQVDELQRQGFTRARRARDGSVILERAHYEAVCRGQVATARPKVRAPAAPKARPPALRPVA